MKLAVKIITYIFLVILIILSLFKIDAGVFLHKTLEIKTQNWEGGTEKSLNDQRMKESNHNILS